MKRFWNPVALALCSLTAIPVFLLSRAKGSDHADTPSIAAAPGTDITDVFLFPSPTNANNVVLVMNVHPLITSANVSSTSFDPNVLYQFKIDTSGDFVEDYVVQAQFSGTGPNQAVSIATGTPITTGTVTQAITPLSVSGTINNTFAPASGIQAFAGVREDPFFFDLNRFFTIFPDRATPLSGTPVSNPNTPQAASWNPPGTASDFLSVGKYNLLSIVVELPKSQLQGAGTGKVNLWCTTSTRN